jgi:integrase
VKDIEKLSSEHVAGWLEFRMECGKARSTVAGDIAALSKLEQALSLWSVKRDSGREYDFQEVLAAAREEARTLPVFEGSRAYSDVPTLIAAIKNDQVHLAVRILSESGSRIAEGTKITAAQLRGASVDRYTGSEHGDYSFVGKGGRSNIGHLSPETYRDLQRHIEQHGSFTVSRQVVRDALKSAAGQTGQVNGYTGAHGLRWTFAQNRMQELQSHGISRDEALAVVSSEMGHNRPEITEIYLR